MGGYGYSAPYTYTGTPLSTTTAATIAQNYVTSIGNPDLVVKQVEEYYANFYVQVNEKSTGNGAFELLINKYTGSVYPEMGPNMMWNTKYGMMRSGILGGIYGAPTTTMPVSAPQATTDAQQYLNTYVPGTTTGDVTTFYGYYTIEVLNGTPSWHDEHKWLQRTSLGSHLAWNLHTGTPSELRRLTFNLFSFLVIMSKIIG